MPDADGDLHVYMLSVGQGDATVVVTPEGKVIVIDAMRPAKLVRLLSDLGLGAGGTIDHLIITHPHKDHFSGANRLARDYDIAKATLAPFWNEFGRGSPTYQGLIGSLYDQQTSCTFLSGYSRWHPDGAMTTSGDGQAEFDDDALYVEMLGPSNGLITVLDEAGVLNTNHLSIMLRLHWRDFRMIVAGDAQMENWSRFDEERMMDEKCQVLRAAHHGSANGTQWERIDRLSPSAVIVSSDPAVSHHLPDLIGVAVLTKFDNTERNMAVITVDSGTIHLKVTPSGQRSLEYFGDSPTENINLEAASPLTEQNNPTDWAELLDDRVAHL